MLSPWVLAAASPPLCRLLQGAAADLRVLLNLGVPSGPWPLHHYFQNGVRQPTWPQAGRGEEGFPGFCGAPLGAGASRLPPACCSPARPPARPPLRHLLGLFFLLKAPPFICLFVLSPSLPSSFSPTLFFFFSFFVSVLCTQAAH